MHISSLPEEKKRHSKRHTSETCVVHNQHDTRGVNIHKTTESASQQMTTVTRHVFDKTSETNLTGDFSADDNALEPIRSAQIQTGLRHPLSGDNRCAQVFRGSKEISDYLKAVIRKIVRFQAERYSENSRLLLILYIKYTELGVHV